MPTFSTLIYAHDVQPFDPFAETDIRSKYLVIIILNERGENKP